MSLLSTYKAKLEKFLNQPKGTNPFIDVLIQVETRTHIPRIYFVLAVIVVCLVVFIVGYGAKFLGNFIGFLYPAYASFKAIESPQEDDDTKWLTYWVTYACFGVFFELSDIIISWIPFYDLLKCCLFIWLMMPGDSNGAMIVYKRFIFPTFHRHESKIDSTLEKIRETASNSTGIVSGITADLKDETSKIATQLTADALAQAMTEGEDGKSK